MNSWSSARLGRQLIGRPGYVSGTHYNQIKSIFNEVSDTQINHESISQENLDLLNRRRVNLFPWRGQFSPQLIEALLNKYAKSDTVVFDPFVGSGTTLFEAARRSLTSIGTEINPAAVQMARTVKFVNLDQDKRDEHIKAAKDIIERNSSSGGCLPNSTNRGTIPEKEAFKEMLDESSYDIYVYNIIANSLMRYFYTKGRKLNTPFEGFKRHAEVIRSLPFNPNPCEVYHSDARKTSLDSESADLIITSPPYINVFNYHQQYREIMEVAGWDLLKIAKLEIGSNRKNRRNRFLTAIQYSIDMHLSFEEMKRILKPDGRIIIIIGRESNIRKISLENYKIISGIAIGGAGLQLVCRHERKFINRFGKKIFEDLLVFGKDRDSNDCAEDFARDVAVYLLKDALNRADGTVKKDIELAIENACEVLPSPPFK